jgi:hypothetical protein
MSGGNSLFVAFGRMVTANGKEGFADRRGDGTGNRYRKLVVGNSVINHE